MSDVTRFHPADFMQNEMDARGWSDVDVAARMGGDPVKTLLIVQMYLAVGKTHDRRLRFGDTAEKFAVAFGISAEFWLNLEREFLNGLLHDGPRQVRP